MWSFSWCRTRRQRSDDGCLASGPFRDRPHRSRCRPDLDRLLGALGRRPLPRAILPGNVTVPVMTTANYYHNLQREACWPKSFSLPRSVTPEKPCLHRTMTRSSWSPSASSRQEVTATRRYVRGEDWRRSGHNATCTMHDRPFHHTPDHFVSSGIGFLEEAPSEELAVWGHDHDDAYRQLPLDDPRQMFSC